MKRLVSILMAISVVLATAAGAAVSANRGGSSAPLSSAGNIFQEESVWEGFYQFWEDGGRTTGGTPILVEHLITIYRENDSLLAEMGSNGYQTARSLVGEVKVEGNRARIYFRSYGELNHFKPYEQGQLLLTLVRTGKGQRARILTYWGAFQPAALRLRNGKVYFKKGRNP